ncbi:MAG: pyridoxal-phosphate dependent enzyme [Gemmatimonadota bacterium]
MEISSLPSSQEVAPLIRGWVQQTPLLPLPRGDGGGESDIHLKLESLQETGSFKVRGAAAALLHLSEDAKRRGVVTCSSGNHGRAVAWMAQRLGIPATIFLPEWTDPSKVAAIRGLGCTVEVGGDSYDAAEGRARAHGAAHDLSWIDPFDDPWVIAGQGTVGVEVLEQLPHVGTILVPLSGGGLAGGIARAVKEVRPQVRVVAVSARNARVMWESVRGGRPISMPEEPTLASALAGGIGEANRWTFPLVQRWVDAHILVEEAAIAQAMAWAFRELKLVVEGGGAVTLAALRPLLAPPGRLPGPGPLVAIISGGNVDSAVLRRSLESDHHHPE